MTAVGIYTSNYGGRGYPERRAPAKSRRPTDSLFKTRPSTVQHSTAQYSTVQLRTAWSPPQTPPSARGQDNIILASSRWTHTGLYWILECRKGHNVMKIIQDILDSFLRVKRSCGCSWFWTATRTCQFKP